MRYIAALLLACSCAHVQSVQLPEQLPRSPTTHVAGIPQPHVITPEERLVFLSQADELMKHLDDLRAYVWNDYEIARMMLDVHNRMWAIFPHMVTLDQYRDWLHAMHVVLDEFKTFQDSSQRLYHIIVDLEQQMTQFDTQADPTPVP